MLGHWGEFEKVRDEADRRWEDRSKSKDDRRILIEEDLTENRAAYFPLEYNKNQGSFLFTLFKT